MRDKATISYDGYTYYCRVHTGGSAGGTHCRVRGASPDPGCTPGSTFRVTAAEVCAPGYADRARDVPLSRKDRVYAEYGVFHRRPGQYEVDHLIPLELGGSNDIRNLWPEAARPAPGFHEKDVLENRLHDEVCAGRLSLKTAQREIATDWLKAYRREFGY